MVRQRTSKDSIKEAFIPSSTDEIHHTRNEYLYVDKVALSTNKFYMIQWLDPFSTSPTKLVDFMRYNIDSDPNKLTYGEKAFISYLRHCWAHLRGVNGVIQSLYLMKGISKVLKEKSSCDYIDILDRNIAHVFEVSAYLKQLESEYTPKDLKQNLIEYLEREYDIHFVKISKEDYSKMESEGPKTIRDTIFSIDGELHYSLSVQARTLLGHSHAHLYNGMRVNSYSRFLSDIFIPYLEDSIKIDEDEALSEFIFGIIAAFEEIYPMIYFVTDFHNMEGKRIGYCFLKEFASFKASTPRDVIVVPKEELSATFDKGMSEEDFLNFLFNNQYVGITYYSYFFKIGQMWREIVSKKCPFTCISKQVSECPLQQELYRKIRDFLLSDQKKSNDVFVKEKIHRFFPSIRVLNIDSKNAELFLRSARK